MSSPNAPPALDRAGRKACWEARDAFFQCLNLHNVPVPPEAGGTGKHSSTCLQERERYEQDCPKSWVSPAGDCVVVGTDEGKRWITLINGVCWRFGRG